MRTRKERALDEVNTGLMAASAKRMREWLAQLRNDNAQGEYYLTDVVVLAAKAGLKVNVIPADSEDEVLGVNDKVQLAEVESIYRRRRATELMLQGVTRWSILHGSMRAVPSPSVGTCTSTSTSCSKARCAWEQPRTHRAERRDPRQ